MCRLGIHARPKSRSDRNLRRRNCVEEPQRAWRLQEQVCKEDHLRAQNCLLTLVLRFPQSREWTFSSVSFRALLRSLSHTSRIQTRQRQSRNWQNGSVLVTKSEDLSFIPRTQRQRKRADFLNCLLTSTCVMVRAQASPAPKHTHTVNQLTPIKVKEEWTLLHVRRLEHLRQWFRGCLVSSCSK